MTPHCSPLQLKVEIEPWAMAEPLKITGYTFDALQFLTVTLTDGVSIGRGEAAGVYYRAETPEVMREQIELLREPIERGMSRYELRALLPPGGARNAVDCALWDLESKQGKTPVWRLASLPAPGRLITTMTLGGGDPEVMAADAAGRFGDARALKLKLLGDGRDIERVAAVRAARSDVWLGVDANQGLTRDELLNALPHFVAANVALIEQPLKVGEEDQLDGLVSPIPIAADESVQSLADLEGLVGRFQAINIKLDKCGGLTEAIIMASVSRALGFKVMVGAMTGTSLAIAPAFLVGQLCDIVDLDAPLFLVRDRDVRAAYIDGAVDIPAGLWGWAE